MSLDDWLDDILNRSITIDPWAIIVRVLIVATHWHYLALRGWIVSKNSCHFAKTSCRNSIFEILRIVKLAWRASVITWSTFRSVCKPWLAEFRSCLLTRLSVLNLCVMPERYWVWKNTYTINTRSLISALVLMSTFLTRRSSEFAPISIVIRTDRALPIWTYTVTIMNFIVWNTNRMYTFTFITWIIFCDVANISWNDAIYSSWRRIRLAVSIWNNSRYKQSIYGAVFSFGACVDICSRLSGIAGANTLTCFERTAGVDLALLC